MKVLLATLIAAWLLLGFVCAPAEFLMFMFPGHFPESGYLGQVMARLDSVDPHVHWRWALLIGSFVVFVFVRRLHKNRAIRAIFCVLIAGMIGSFYDFDFMRAGGSAMVGLLTCVAAAVFVFWVASDTLMSGLAEKLTRYRGERWVKEIDYVYLMLGSIGVVSAVFRIEKSRGASEITLVDWFGPLILSIALAIRFVKTRAELNEWNKLSTWERAGPKS